MLVSQNTQLYVERRKSSGRSCCDELISTDLMQLDLFTKLDKFPSRILELKIMHAWQQNQRCTFGFELELLTLFWDSGNVDRKIIYSVRTKLIAAV